ncbi:ABC transporter substrate-binding protein, partial [Vibrio alfacsensis]
MKKTLLLTSAIAASMVIPAHAEESSSMPNLKILNEFSTGWVRNFNPWFGGRSDFAYESLYIFDILDSKNVHPWLATGYE